MAHSPTRATGNSAVLLALEHDLRVVFCDALILDPRNDRESQEIVQLIFEGHGDRLTVEDPTLRGELS
jgi:hypothetical protein